MSLDDLSAAELAKIDAVCLDYESRLRRGQAPSIGELVAAHGGKHAAELRRELELVRDELASSHKGSNLARTEAEKASSTYFDPVALPTPGTKIGPYVVGEILGRGGMGVVFSALDTRLSRKVAIKMLAVEIAKRRDLTERFDREARAVAAISHPNIVELFDVGSANGLPYAVMEYLDGELLEIRLRRGRLAADEVRRIGAQVADALATAHQTGVVHRDLKPRNIMLVPRGGIEIAGIDEQSSRAASHQSADGSRDPSTLVKLFDFGLSRVPRLGFGESAQETGDGVILGTPGYMAPEQARGEVVTPAADIFSLGCVLYEAFYGERAFDGDTKAQRFAATLNQDPQPDPMRRRDDVALADLIARCLEKEASDRPESAATIARQLRVRSPGVEASVAESRRNAIHRRRLLLLAGGTTAGMVAGAIYWSPSGDELVGIDSLAVLSFASGGSRSAAGMTEAPAPVGDARLRQGDRLAMLLVHELTRLTEVTVPRFRPLAADTPAQFREIGAALEVDALVTGNMRTVQHGSTELLEIDVQIVSAKTGNQLWSKQIQTESGDNLLEQSKLASEIAAAIGHRLTSTSAQQSPPSVESFSCLVDGKTRSDPDSLQGLEMALMCFQKAREQDRRFADPVAGIALTSITLAAQTGTEKAMELVRQARESAEEALRLDPKSIDGRLANAMLDWQTVGRYRQADRTFQELVVIAPNDWQVRHQYGLLLLTMGRTSEASRSLREASQLNPMSVLAKVDRARAHWFQGNPERAIQDATRIRDRYDRNLFARGLLVDIFEQQQRFDLAAAEHDQFQWPAGASQEEYLHRRGSFLGELPYGPYGDDVNAAILQTRTAAGLDDPALADLADPMPPMLPLVLAAHPSFSAVRLLPRAREILPPPTENVTALGRRKFTA